ncbi:hypothetical protein Ddc_14136 [Ditylenchus destructor]|nr:hypothetical protein Ddc_14136 [Ditylenchus destructor]
MSAAVTASQTKGHLYEFNINGASVCTISGGGLAVEGCQAGYCSRKINRPSSFFLLHGRRFLCFGVGMMRVQRAWQTTAAEAILTRKMKMENQAKNLSRANKGEIRLLLKVAAFGK